MNFLCVSISEYLHRRTGGDLGSFKRDKAGFWVPKGTPEDGEKKDDAKNFEIFSKLVAESKCFEITFLNMFSRVTREINTMDAIYEDIMFVVESETEFFNWNFENKILKRPFLNYIGIADAVWRNSNDHQQAYLANPDIQAGENRVVELKDQISKLSLEYEYLKENHEVVLNKITDVEGNVDRDADDARRKVEFLAHLRERTDELEEEVRVKGALIVDLEAEKSSLLSDLKKQRKTSADLRKINKALSEENKSVKTYAEGCEIDLTKKGKTILELLATNEETRGKMKELAVNGSELQTIIEELEAVAEAKEIELDDLRRSRDPNSSYSDSKKIDLSSVVCGEQMQKTRDYLKNSHKIESDRALLDYLPSISSMIPEVYRDCIFFVAMDEMKTRFDKNTLGPYAAVPLASERSSKKDIVLIQRAVAKINLYLISQNTLLRVFIKRRLFDGTFTIPSIFLTPGHTTILNPGNYSMIFPNKEEDEELKGLFSMPSYADVELKEPFKCLLKGDKPVPSALSDLSFNAVSLRVLQKLEGSYKGIKDGMYKAFAKIKNLDNSDKEKEIMTVALESGWVGNGKYGEKIKWKYHDLNFLKGAEPHQISDRRVPVIFGEILVIEGNIFRIDEDSFDNNVNYFPVIFSNVLAWTMYADDIDDQLLDMTIGVAKEFSKRNYLKYIKKCKVSSAWNRQVSLVISRNKLETAKGKLQQLESQKVVGPNKARQDKEKAKINVEIAELESTVSASYTIPSMRGSQQGASFHTDNRRDEKDSAKSSAGNPMDNDGFA